jgi:hypothetical protein
MRMTAGGDCDFEDVLSVRSYCVDNRGSSRAVTLLRANCWASSACKERGTREVLDVRGGSSSFPGLKLGAVETLLTPREWPRAVAMDAVL